MNNLPRVAARQCTGRELNPRPIDRESNALATKPPSHPINTLNSGSHIMDNMIFADMNEGGLSVLLLLLLLTLSVFV